MVKEPSRATLDKYGLSPAEWKEIADRQGHVCAVCKKLPKSGRLNIDHQHVPRWKSKPPEERRKFVRGLLCHHCNRFYLAKAMTIAKALNCVDYLRDYEIRKANPVMSKSVIKRLEAQKEK